ncbi:MAG TPA: UDP-galactopyranose mutase [Sphingomonadaceae bacterium]|nr:UDP-galactopyranose mutase [Sphingomonadaceae bacterium]
MFQRPQHLMQRFAKVAKVVYWEEPIPAAGAEFGLDRRECNKTGSTVTVITPHVPHGWSDEQAAQAQAEALDRLVASENRAQLIRWYYTPMMLHFSRGLAADCTVYDCMDELANFKDAPPTLMALEAELLEVADVVFTGGYSLFEAKKDRHANIHPFPSSVDVAHFAAARNGLTEPADQAGLPRPRLGFYGVIDERLDLDLIGAVAAARPDWQIVMLGPVVKIDPATLPSGANLHFLGGKSYDELPAYLKGWDVALMPFAINEATRFISPTKTPEYLAAGKPVVSTPIRDVVRHYGTLDGVAIASTADEFVAACEQAMTLSRSDDWLAPVDVALAALSWDKTFNRMKALIDLAAADNGSQPRRPEAAAMGKLRTAQHYDVVIVGAGFAGSVMAERLAADAGKRVLVIDKRPHIAGNAFDVHDEAGILMHQYGPHIFHTNSAEITDYLSRFTEWRMYEHRVIAVIDDMRVPMPINRTTINMLYGLELTTDEEAEAYYQSVAEPVGEVRTSRDVVVGRVGRDLYERFFECYTRKQWAMDPSELDKSVTARVPVRTNTDDRYFTDTFQQMPLEGYTKMFERMLDHPKIDLMLGVDFADVKHGFSYDQLVWTGPVDEYFGHCYGPLPYRSLSFEHVTMDQETFQESGTVNYPAEKYPYTRISEYKYLTGQVHPKTTVTYEYPQAEGDPYYPIPRPENAALYKRYEALADASDVVFVGRLATYRYYNMDQVVGQALSAYKRMRKAELSGREAVGAAAEALAKVA